MKTIGPLLRYLERRDEVSDQERQVLENLPWRIRQFSSGEAIVRRGTAPGESCLLMKGFAARSEGMAEGTRQFTAIHLAGDFVDLHSLLLKVMDHDVVALKACTVGFVPHENLREITESSPHLGRLLWLSTAIDGAIQRAWIVSMGRRSARGQLAHLICELYARMEVIGLVDGDRFEIPITQAELADMMGMSTVHANRTLQELRAENLISWEHHVVTVLDADRLRHAAEFDPTYLNLERRPR